MAKDYAKRVFTTTRKHKKKKRRIEFYVIPAVFICCIAGFAGYKYNAYLSISHKSWSQQLKSLISHKTVKPAAPAAKTAVAEAEQEMVHFEFYSTLPKMKVTASKIEEHDAKAPSLNE